MEHALLDLASRYGYLVVLLGVGIESMGIPVPGETALLVGAVLAGSGHLSWALVGLAGWTGAVLGDNTGYAVGRRFGSSLRSLPGLRRVYSPARTEAAERFFERRGWTAVFFGRFIAVLRIFAGPLAGMHRMPWRSFVAANAAGAAAWVSAVLLVGVLLGSNLDRAARLLRTTGYLGLALAVAAVAAGWAVGSGRLHGPRPGRGGGIRRSASPARPAAGSRRTRDRR